MGNKLPNKDKSATSYLKYIFIRTFAVLIGIFVALFILELLVRVTFPYQSDSYLYFSHFVPSEETGWRFKSNLSVENAIGLGPPDSTIQLLNTNSLGLRDTLEPFEVGKDAFVVAIQGDSNVAGFGLNSQSTLSHQLEILLNSCSETQPYTVLNFGISGYDLNQYVIQREVLSKAYNIDVWVMVFNLSNDLSGTALEFTYRIPRPYFTLQDNQLQLNKRRYTYPKRIYPVEFIPAYTEYQYLLEPMNPRSQFLINSHNPLSHSYLFIESVSRLHNYCQRCSDFLVRREKKRFSEQDKLLHAAFQPYRGYWIYIDPMPEPYHLHHPTIKALFEQWYDDDPANPDQMVLLMPDKRAVISELFSEKQQAAEKIGLGVLNKQHPTDYLQEILQDIGVTSLDPLAQLLQESDPWALFLEDDDHYSEQGHAILAQVISQHLHPKCEVDN